MTKSAALAAIIIVLVAFRPAVVLADEVPNPPESCPEGTRAEGTHCGQTCDPWTCTDNAPCEGGTCQTVALCVEEITCGASGGPYTKTVARGRCVAGACVRGSCQTLQVCVAEGTAPGSSCVRAVGCGAAGPASVLPTGGILVLMLLLGRRCGMCRRRRSGSSCSGTPG